MSNRSISITIHPSQTEAEYLTVEDAMRQILDMVETLEKSEARSGAERRIVWRLTKAHTNSPPLTVTAEAFPSDPEVSIMYEATRILVHLKEDAERLMSGYSPKWMGPQAERSFSRVLARNLNGIARTEAQLDDMSGFSIVPSKARVAMDAIARDEVRAENYERVEIGTAEVEVIGLTKYYNAPALVVRERLSGEKLYCVLSESLARLIGPERSWHEAWQGKMYRFSGEMVFSKDGKLKRINAFQHEDVVWKNVELSDLANVDITAGKAIQEHLDEFWGENYG